MNATVHIERFRFEIACRGRSASNLAQDARFDPATISAALSGQTVAATFITLFDSGSFKAATCRDHRGVSSWQ